MKSLEELRAIREKMQGKVGVRAENENQTRVVVGMATCGIASGADVYKRQHLMKTERSSTGPPGLMK